MKRTKKLSILAFAIVLVFTAFTGSTFAADDSDSNFYANFAKVGQADSILLEQGKHYILVDTGTHGTKLTVTNMMKARGATKLDALVITHYDGDHVGALNDIVDYLASQNGNRVTGNIAKVYGRLYGSAELTIIKKYDSNNFYQNYINFINTMIRISGSSVAPLPTSADPATVAATGKRVHDEGTLWIFPNRSNASFKFGAEPYQVTMRFKNRVESYVTNPHKDQPITDSTVLAKQVNNDSLVFRIATLGTKASLLFLGDVQDAAVADLVGDAASYPIGSDVLKLGHHGYQGSTSEALLKLYDDLQYSVMTVDSEDDAEQRMQIIIDRKDNVIKSDFGQLLYTATASSYGTITVNSAGHISQTGLGAL